MKLEILHRIRWLKQLLLKPDISVAGGYHLGNAGDILMGRSVQQLLQKKFNRKGQLQTIYNLDKWPKAKKVILGGGAIAYSRPINLLMECYPDPKNVMILGVDFNERYYEDKVIDYLRKIPIIITRSDANNNYLAKILGRNDILSLPDLGFAWHNEDFQSNRTRQKELRLVVNLMPIYMEKIKDTYRPIEQYRNERPDLYVNIEEIFNNYLLWAEGIINNYREAGYNITAVAFTPADEELMLGLPFIRNSEVLPYESNMGNYLNILLNADTLLCTRFHATLVGLRSFSKIIPFAYAYKNEELLMSAGISLDKVLTPSKLLSLSDNYNNPISFEPTTIIQLEKRAYNSYCSIIESFL